MAPLEPSALLPISELSSYTQRWTIRARVTSKSALRSFSKGNSTGKVFHVQLLDALGGEIRASFFNEAVEGNFDRLQTGKCFTFSRGNIRLADQRYSTCQHRYELVFDRAAQIEEAEEGDKIDSVKLVVADLRSVQARSLPCSIDLCGVITHFSQALAFTSKEGKDLVKREVTVADDTATSLVVTLWGERAKWEDQTFEGKPVVGMKGVVVKEWNGGRTGSLSEGGALIINPDISEAQRVRSWWLQRDPESPAITALSVAGGRSNSSLTGAKSLDLAGVRKVSEQVVNQTELYTVVCRLAMVQMTKKGENQPLTYMACQENKDGKPMACNRRVDSSGFCVSCGKSGKVAARFNLRCRFADHGDQVWLTTFHEAAQQVVGMSAEKAWTTEQAEGGRESVEAAIAGKYFSQPFQLVLRAKLDSYNGESRTNVTCIDARPVRRGERGRALLAEVEKLLGQDSEEAK